MCCCYRIHGYKFAALKRKSALVAELASFTVQISCVLEALYVHSSFIKL